MTRVETEDFRDQFLNSSGPSPGRRTLLNPTLGALMILLAAGTIAGHSITHVVYCDQELLRVMELKARYAEGIQERMELITRRPESHHRELRSQIEKLERARKELEDRQKKLKDVKWKIFSAVPRAPRSIYEYEPAPGG